MTAEAVVTVITPEEAKAKIDGGDVAIIDVRMAYDWAGERIKGSINLPNNAIAFRTGEVPKDKDLIIYGTNTTKASNVAKKALELGFPTVFVIDGGFDAWLDAGMPSESITG